MSTERIPSAYEFLFNRKGRHIDPEDLIEFTKLHVQAALKAANLVVARTDMWGADDTVITNSYPLDNIK